MDPRKLSSIHNLAVLSLFILLIFSGGFLWGEFKKVSGIIDSDEATEQMTSSSTPVAPEYKKGETAKGKELFITKCQRCHLVDKKLTGPALMNVKDRWSDSTHLYSWIRNSQSFLASGDKYANDLFRKYNSVMPPFPELKEEDIREILFYVDPE